jgi:hypothetical protein
LQCDRSRSFSRHGSRKYALLSKCALLMSHIGTVWGWMLAKGAIAVPGGERKTDLN